MPEPPLLEKASELSIASSISSVTTYLKTRGPVLAVRSETFSKDSSTSRWACTTSPREIIRGRSASLGAGVAALERFRPEREGLDVDGLLAGVWRCLEKSEQAEAPDSVTWSTEDIPRMDYRGLV